MQSSLGWVDFSSEHRDRVRTVIDLLATPGVVDELGIGIIRDAFSDYLFPGVSTIQTRPKYFLIVPRILKDYEAMPDKQRQRVSLREYLADEEMACRVDLATRYEGEEGLGIIGVSFGERTDRDVQRPPSSVYWNGLRTFGIVRSKLSLPEYCRRHTGHRPSLRMLLEETREEQGDDVDADDVGISPVIRMPDHDQWREDLAITLTTDEAVFLRQQICATQPESLIGQILLSEVGTEAFVALAERAAFADLVELLSELRLLDDRLLRVAYLANAFWQILRGAHVRYNLLLQRRFGSATQASKMQDSWLGWTEEMHAFDWSSWDTDHMWQLVAGHGSRVRPWTERFVNGWIAAASRGETDTQVHDDLVVQQEGANKRSRARLRPHNRDEALGEWVGIQDLSYRLPQAWRLVTDINRAETGEADADAGL